MAIENIGKKTNKVSVGRRSSEDPKWTECKEQVRKRDKGRCQFQFCISLKEAYLLKDGSQKALDPAHVISASVDPTIIYNPKNVVTLQRFIHRRMDNFQNPLTGEDLNSHNEHWYWWWRITQHKSINYDENTDYKELIYNYVYQS